MGVDSPADEEVMALWRVEALTYMLRCVDINNHNALTGIQSPNNHQ